MNWQIQEKLPYRQAETLIGLLEGKTTKEIAKDAGVSPATVNDAVNTLAHRLRLHRIKRALIVAEALERGWVKASLSLVLVALTAQLFSGSIPDARPNSRTARTSQSRTRTTGGRRPNKDDFLALSG